MLYFCALGAFESVDWPQPFSSWRAISPTSVLLTTMASKRMSSALSAKSKANPKKSKAGQRFKESYLKTAGIKQSKRGDEFVWCEYCCVDLDITHSGQYDFFFKITLFFPGDYSFLKWGVGRSALISLALAHWTTMTVTKMKD